MSKKRKSFIVHHDSLNVLDDLTNEQAGLLFKAIKSYHTDGDIELDAITKVAFSFFKNQFERDAEKYEKLCEKNRLIAEKRYNTKSTTGKTGNQSSLDSTKSTDNKSKNDSDSKSDSKNISIAKARRFTPPTDIETVSYFQEKGSTAQEAEKFWYFYDAKNWMVGKNKMKKWKSAANGWIKRNSDNSQSALEQSSNSNWHLQNQGF